MHKTADCVQARPAKSLEVVDSEELLDDDWLCVPAGAAHTSKLTKTQDGRIQPAGLDFGALRRGITPGSRRNGGGVRPRSRGAAARAPRVVPRGADAELLLGPAQVRLT
jgi:hypothetical protein